MEKKLFRTLQEKYGEQFSRFIRNKGLNILTAQEREAAANAFVHHKLQAAAEEQTLIRAFEYGSKAIE